MEVRKLERNQAGVGTENKGITTTSHISDKFFFKYFYFLRTLCNIFLSYPFPSPPNFMFFLFLKSKTSPPPKNPHKYMQRHTYKQNMESSLCWPTTLECGWYISVSLHGKTVTFFLLSQQLSFAYSCLARGGTLCSLSLLHAGLFSDLSLSWSCGFCGSYGSVFEFIWTSGLLCLEIAIPVKLLTASGS